MARQLLGDDDAMLMEFLLARSVSGADVKGVDLLARGISNIVSEVAGALLGYRMSSVDAAVEEGFLP